MSDNLNGKGKQVFEDYRLAYDMMESNSAIRRARRAIEQYRASLEKLEAPYRKKMARAETAIVETVLAREGSVTLFGVYAKYTKGRASRSWKGRASRSWKSIATAMKAPQELIDEYTTVGKPNVSVSIKKEE